MKVMVSTRHHPGDFSVKSRSSPVPAGNTADRNKGHRWTHSPPPVVLVWFFLSIPFVLWDAGYVMLRPYSMPGGKLHSPLWTPYALYGTIDYIYGFPAFNEGNGFTAAQAFMNIIETGGQMIYLYIVYRYAAPVKNVGRGYSKQGGKTGALWLLENECVLSGRQGAIALLVAYSVSVMTASKTILYCE